MNRIKEVPAKKDITRTLQPEKLGKSCNRVSGYAQNRPRPRLDVLFEIAEIPEVNPKDLWKDDLDD